MSFKRRRELIIANNIGSTMSFIDNYLTIKALEDGLTASLSINACEYCVDGDGNWKTLAANTVTESINTGQTLSFRGNLTPDIHNSIGIGTFTINKRCSLKGNCMSLLFGDDANNNNDLGSNNYSNNNNLGSYTYWYAFKELFLNCTTIVSVSSNFLPASGLVEQCYMYMFSGCTELTNTPLLLASTLHRNCYKFMFLNCTKLTNVRKIEAVTMASQSCESMFQGCTSLIKAPLLDKVITTVDYSYYRMFKDCSALVEAPKITAQNLGTYACAEMFMNCVSLVTAPSIPATTLDTYCCYNMFSNCSSLINPSALLPATTLKSNCYDSMFSGCTSLVTAPTLPATTLATYCYSNMFNDCTSLTTAPELPATTLKSNCYDSMFSGCTNLNYIKAMFTTKPSNTYTKNWVSGVSSIGTFVKNKNATWDVTGVNAIPSGWTVITE